LGTITFDTDTAPASPESAGNIVFSDGSRIDVDAAGEMRYTSAESVITDIYTGGAWQAPFLNTGTVVVASVDNNSGGAWEQGTWNAGNVTIDLADVKQLADAVVGAINELESTKTNTAQVSAIVTAEASIREAADAELDMKIRSVQGQGGYLNAHDFGAADLFDDAGQEALTQYALSQISGITDPNEIWNGTRVKNLYVDPSTVDDDHPDGVPDGRVWILNNTPETIPPIFEWADDGPETTGAATNDRFGLVKGVADPGDGSEDGNVTITGGIMRTIGWERRFPPGSYALYNNTRYFINRPDLWPAAVTLDFGSGLKGKRRTGTTPAIAANTDYTISVVEAGSGITRIVNCGGQVMIANNGYANSVNGYWNDRECSMAKGLSDYAEILTRSSSNRNAGLSYDVWCLYQTT
jgi:hypothetical protein